MTKNTERKAAFVFTKDEHVSGDTETVQLESENRALHYAPHVSSYHFSSWVAMYSLRRRFRSAPIS